jgi:hypothetical protein
MIPDQAVGFEGIADIAGCLAGVAILLREFVIARRIIPEKNDNLA